MALPRWCYRCLAWLFLRQPTLLLWLMDYGWRVFFACCAGLGVTLVWLRFGWRVTAVVVAGFAAYTVIVLAAAQCRGFNGDEKQEVGHARRNAR